MLKKIRTKDIALMGLLMALQIILTRFVVIQTDFFRISFLFLPTALMGIFFGPLLTGLGCGLADLFGFFLFSRGSFFFPGFTLSAIVSGVIYSLFFHKHPLTLKRNIMANLVNMLLVEMLMNSVWLFIMYDQAAKAYLAFRIGTSIVMFFIKVISIHFMSNQRVFKEQLKKF